MKTDFKSHKMCIFGIQESGKTWWAMQMYRHFKKPLVFVVNDDDADKWIRMKKIYVYKADRNNIQEDFKKFIKFAKDKALSGEIDLIIIDEADMFFQTNWHIEPDLNDLVLNHRHMGKKGEEGVAIWFMTRRPQDMPTKIVESSKFLIIFKLEGANAIKRFGEIHPAIPQLVEKLDYTRHNFVFKEIGKEPKIHAPLTPFK